MYSNSGYHWSEKLDDDMHAVLTEQDAIQAEIDASMRSGDLLGAATASFDHVVTSTESGDHIEAAAYALVGVMFSQANWMVSEKNKHDSIIFDLPESVTKEVKPCDLFQNTHKGTPGYTTHKLGYGRKTYRKIAKNEALQAAVAGVEAILLEGDSVNPTIKNEAVREAVNASCELFFDDYNSGASDYLARSKPDPSQILELASNLTDHLEIDGGDESNLSAIHTFNMLALAAINEEGSSFPILNKCIQGLEEIQETMEYPSSDIAFIVQRIKSAKKSKIAFTVLARPLINLNTLVTGGNSQDYEPARPLKYVQNDAWQSYRKQYANPIDIEAWLGENGLELETFATAHARAMSAAQEPRTELADG